MRGIIIFLSFLYIYSFSCIEKKNIIGYNHNKDCAQYKSAQQKNHIGGTNYDKDLIFTGTGKGLVRRNFV